MFKIIEVEETVKKRGGSNALYKYIYMPSKADSISKFKIVRVKNNNKQTCDLTADKITCKLVIKQLAK